MKIYIPWIISRRRFIIAAFIDLLLNTILYSIGFSSNLILILILLFTFSLASYWIIFSYILGRYMICKRINFIEIFKTIIKTIIILLSYEFIYLTLNLSNNFINLIFGNLDNIINIQREQNIFFIKTTLIIALISCISQYILSIITNKIYSYKKKYGFFMDLREHSIILKLKFLITKTT